MSACLHGLTAWQLDSRCCCMLNCRRLARSLVAVVPMKFGWHLDDTCDSVKNWCRKPSFATYLCRELRIALQNWHVLCWIKELISQILIFGTVRSLRVFSRSTTGDLCGKRQKWKSCKRKPCRNSLESWGMAAWPTFECFESASNKVEWRVERPEWQRSDQSDSGIWSRQMDKDTNEFVNRTKAGIHIFASLASVFWGWLCIMIFILAHFRDEGGPPKRPADVLFLRTRIRSAVAGRSLCEKDWRHWRSSSTCFNTLDKSCALVNHLSFAISYNSSWAPAPRWR